MLRAYGRVLIRIYPELQATEIDDLVQDALLKLQSLHIIDRIKAAVSPAGYIAIMLRNAATDLLRQRRRSFELSIAEEFEAPSGVDEDVATHYNAAKLRRALVRLTAEERNLLRMRFWRNLSIAQIAEILGTSYSAAAVRLFRILHRLREELR
ncbi:MAG TPA: sigma-70 family RNA polymerase sigma factor [Terriglobales bacterium]|nr:sigma-70 family RNA polymerase sigma factor [Terriglobales bacterium]